MEEQEAFASGQDVVYTNTEGPAQRFRGLPTQAEMEQLNAGNASPVTPEQEALIAEMTQPRSVDEAPVLTPEQEVFINGLMPGSGGYLTVPSIPSMPLPMMPAPPAMRPALPPMMPRQTPNLSTRRMNPRFTR